MNTNDITIIPYDPYDIYEDIKKIYKEESGGIELTETEPRAIDYRVLALYLSSVKAEMNDVAKQNYLRWARDDRLDLKGEIYGSKGSRITPGKARTTMRCEIEEIKNRDIVIPKGTRFIKDTYVFKTLEEVKVKSGNTYVDVVIENTAEGYTPNFEIGEIKEIVDVYDYFKSCSNVTKVIGGVEEEEDESYRNRLRQVPESFSTAGSEGGYCFWVKSASNLIKDVKVIQTKPCHIDIYIAGEKGEEISSELKELVFSVINDKKIRPQGDLIQIKSPEKISFTVDIKYFIYKKDATRAIEIKNNINRAIQAWIDNLSSKMGYSINTQDIIEICKTNGARRVEITHPTDTEITEKQIAKCTHKNIQDGGVDIYDADD